MEPQAKMKTQDARALGQQLCALVDGGRIAQAYEMLSPILTQKTPFCLLDVIGTEMGCASLRPVNAFLEHIAADKTMGGWVVTASALAQQLPYDLPGAFLRCRRYVVAGDVWYTTDILGERVPGPALMADFDQALAHLAPWRTDENRWVRRTVGVAVHFWAKRSRGVAEFSIQAEHLLVILEPKFEECDTDAIKGIGWGLKTIGKHYPDLLVEWLGIQSSRSHRALMMKKALTYLSSEQRVQVVGNKR
jgi:3-methyladenine DNA glycosylase AlkD